MISVKIARGLVVVGVAATAGHAPAAAQDASFPCKVLLCSQANWPTIPYCVPIMQQAAWMNFLGIGVGICIEAMQSAQQNQSNSSGGPLNGGGQQAGYSGAGSPGQANCPSGSVPMTATSGGYSVDFGGSLCGTPLTSQARSDLGSCAASYSAVCSKIFTTKDVSAN